MVNLEFVEAGQVADARRQRSRQLVLGEIQMIQALQVLNVRRNRPGESIRRKGDEFQGRDGADSQWNAS